MAGESIEYELEHPVQLIGKGSGKVMLQADKLTLRPPEARDFIELEGLMRTKPIAFQIGMIQRLSGLDPKLADKLRMSDVRKIQQAMEGAGFFDLDDEPPATAAEAEEETILV